MANEKRAIRVRMAGGVLLISAFAAAIGYVVATGVVQYWFGHSEPDFLWLVRNYTALQAQQPQRWVIVNTIIAGFFCVGLLLASRIVQEQLTRFGTTHWMTARELKRKNFFGELPHRVRSGEDDRPQKEGPLHRLGQISSLPAGRTDRPR